MLVISNYPQVPIATTNAATDSARVENQQRPPIVPPPQLSKGHEERALNPKYERAADEPQARAKRQQLIDEKQQDRQQQQQSDEERQPRAKGLKLPARLSNALGRKDVRVHSPTRPARSPLGSKASTPAAGQPGSFYRAVAAHVGAYYHLTCAPRQEADFNAWV